MEKRISIKTKLNIFLKNMSTNIETMLFNDPIKHPTLGYGAINLGPEVMKKYRHLEIAYFITTN